MLRWGNVGFLLAGTSTYAHTRLIMHLAFDPESSQLVGFFWLILPMQRLANGCHEVSTFRLSFQQREHVWGIYRRCTGKVSPATVETWRQGVLTVHMD